MTNLLLSPDFLEVLHRAASEFEGETYLSIRSLAEAGLLSPASIDAIVHQTWERFGDWDPERAGPVLSTAPWLQVVPEELAVIERWPDPPWIETVGLKGPVHAVTPGGPFTVPYIGLFGPQDYRIFLFVRDGNERPLHPTGGAVLIGVGCGDHFKHNGVCPEADANGCDCEEIVGRAPHGEKVVRGCRCAP